MMKNKKIPFYNSMNIKNDLCYSQIQNNHLKANEEWVGQKSKTYVPFIPSIRVYRPIKPPADRYEPGWWLVGGKKTDFRIPMKRNLSQDVLFPNRLKICKPFTHNEERPRNKKVIDFQPLPRSDIRCRKYFDVKTSVFNFEPLGFRKSPLLYNNSLFFNSCDHTVEQMMTRKKRPENIFSDPLYRRIRVECTPGYFKECGAIVGSTQKLKKSESTDLFSTSLLGTKKRKIKVLDDNKIYKIKNKKEELDKVIHYVAEIGKDEDNEDDD